MYVLIKSNFLRIIKSPSLWVCCALQAVITLVQAYISLKTLEFVPLDSLFTATLTIGGFPITPWMILLTGAFFFGEELKSRAINNKLILGYSRTQVLTAGFVAVLTGAFVMYAVKLLSICIFVLPLTAFGGYFSFRWQYNVAVLFNSVFILTFYSALVTFIASISTNTVGILWRIILLYAIIFTFAFLGVFQMNFFEQEYLDFAVRSVITDYPHIEISPETPSKAARDFNKFLFDLLPMGQCMQIDSGYPLCLLQTVPYCILDTAIVLGGSILVTKKRNFS